MRFQLLSNETPDNDTDLYDRKHDNKAGQSIDKYRRREYDSVEICRNSRQRSIREEYACKGHSPFISPVERDQLQHVCDGDYVPG